MVGRHGGNISRSAGAEMTTKAEMLRAMIVTVAGGGETSAVGAKSALRGAQGQRERVEREGADNAMTYTEAKSLAVGDRLECALTDAAQTKPTGAYIPVKVTNIL